MFKKRNKYTDDHKCCFLSVSVFQFFIYRFNKTAADFRQSDSSYDDESFNNYLEMIEEAVHRLLNADDQMVIEQLFREFAEGMWTLEDGELVRRNEFDVADATAKNEEHRHHSNDVPLANENSQQRRRITVEDDAFGVGGCAVYDAEERVRLSAHAGGYSDKAVRQRALSELLNSLS